MDTTLSHLPPLSNTTAFSYTTTMPGTYPSPVPKTHTSLSPPASPSPSTTSSPAPRTAHSHPPNPLAHHPSPPSPRRARSHSPHRISPRVPVRRKSHTPHTHAEALESDPESLDTPSDTLSDDESFWSAAASVEYRVPARKLTPFPVHGVGLGAAEERGGRRGLTLIPEGGSAEEGGGEEEGSGGSGGEEKVRRMKLKGKYRADEVVDGGSGQGVMVVRKRASVGALGGEGMWLRSKSRRAGGEMDDHGFDYAVDKMKGKARYCADEPVDGGRCKDTNRVRNRESEDSFIGKQSQQRSYSHQEGHEVNDRDRDQAQDQDQDQDQDHTRPYLMFTTDYRTKDAMDDSRHQGSSLIPRQESKNSLARKKVHQPSYNRQEGNRRSDQDYVVQSTMSAAIYHTKNPMDGGSRKSSGKESQRPPHSYQDGNEMSDRDEEKLNMTSAPNYCIGDFDLQQPSYSQQESNNTNQENHSGEVERVKPNTKATDNTTLSSWATSSKHPPTPHPHGAKYSTSPARLQYIPISRHPTPNISPPPFLSLRNAPAKILTPQDPLYRPFTNLHLASSNTPSTSSSAPRPNPKRHDSLSDANHAFHPGFGSLLPSGYMTYPHIRSSPLYKGPPELRHMSRPQGEARTPVPAEVPHSEVGSGNSSLYRDDGVGQRLVVRRISWREMRSEGEGEGEGEAGAEMETESELEPEIDTQTGMQMHAQMHTQMRSLFPTIPTVRSPLHQRIFLGHHDGAVGSSGASASASASAIASASVNPIHGMSDDSFARLPEYTGDTPSPGPVQRKVRIASPDSGCVVWVDGIQEEWCGENEGGTGKGKGKERCVDDGMSGGDEGRDGRDGDEGREGDERQEENEGCEGSEGSDEVVAKKKGWGRRVRGWFRAKRADDDDDVENGERRERWWHRRRVGRGEGDGVLDRVRRKIRVGGLKGKVKKVFERQAS